jgi:undecaprenyl diphosphate synthase
VASRAGPAKFIVGGEIVIRKPTPHKSGATPPTFSASAIPHHVALVMDGNGRWAKERGLPRTAGHEAGESALFDVVEGAIEIGIKEVSAYAFSTENWGRSPEEVKFLMGFNRDVIRRRRDEMNELGVRVRWVGRPKRLWTSVIQELVAAEELTAKNKILTLNMCVNYGGRAEIVDAATSLARDVKAGTVKLENISEKTFGQYLYQPSMSNVDLFLRSSGEMRTSNFLPWQSVYAEMVFMDVLWPDVDRRILWRAVEEFSIRQRRFGTA